ncbi:MAG: hypothetical protein WBA74_05315 [Cyclobacteriaceae bacterium]
MKTPNHKNLDNLLKISCFLLFLGRAWQFLFWDAPLRALLWDEDLMEKIVVNVFNVTWYDYVTNEKADMIIQGAIQTTGLFYLCMAIVSLFIHSNFRFGKALLGISSLSLLFLAFLYCKEKFYHHGQFFEYAIQFSLPVFLLIITYYRKQVAKANFILFIKIAVALTFVSHGLYAIGFYPRPGIFIDMTINSLGVTEPVAHQILLIAGILDFIAAIGLFLNRIAKPFIIYCIVWGLLTAVARTWANIQIDFPDLAILSQYLPQTLYRLPHGLLPVALLISSASGARTHTQTNSSDLSSSSDFDPSVVSTPLHKTV